MSKPANSKVPKIRFKGFAGEWEEKTLGESGDTQSGVGFPDAEQGGKCGTPFFKVSDMSRAGNEHEMLTSNNYVTEAQLKRKRWTPISDVPAMIFAKVGAALMLNRKRIVRSPFLIDNNMMAYLFDETWDTDFGRTLFDTINLPLYAQIGALPSYNGSDIETIVVNRPVNKAEQTQIGGYFREVDRLLGLQQRKHDKLVTLKKAMLHAMFPQPGTTTPEIRFKGFSGDWVEKKLGELMPITSAARVHKHEWTSSGVPFFRTSDVVSRFKGEKNERAFISVELYEQLSKKVGRIKRGDILITGGGSIGIPFLADSDEPLYFKDADLLWLKVPEGIDSTYLYVFFTSAPFRTYLKSISHIGTIGHYTVEQAKGTPITIPGLAEQQKLGHYFRTLDQLIAQHALQLQKLKQLKAACLERMFV